MSRTNVHLYPRMDYATHVRVQRRLLEAGLVTNPRTGETFDYAACVEAYASARRDAAEPSTPEPPNPAR